MRAALARLIPVALLVAVVVCAGPGKARPRVSGDLRQNVYVWQRGWGPEVRGSVAGHAGAFESVIVLGAEVAWEGGRAVVSRARVDWAALAPPRVVGVAVRVGTPPAGRDVSAVLADAAAGVVREARATGVELVELQLDYDCATSKLAAYRAWVGAVREAVAPTPLTITALPAWLSSAEFAPLAREAGGFVLQVHAVERPRLEDPEARLCDDARAAAWVERAAGAGVPFRVALPTYGYLVVYGPKGDLRGVIAEAAAPEIETGSSVRELRADPAAMASLVRRWSDDRPALMRGVIWYRLPIEGDRLNWSWPTLARVMRGEAPAPNLAVRVTRTEAGLAEVALVNQGDADARLPGAVRVRWNGPEALAADGLGGMEDADGREGERRFVRGASLVLERIGAGRERPVGWIRLASDTEVTGDVVP